MSQLKYREQLNIASLGKSYDETLKLEMSAVALKIIERSSTPEN